MTSLLTATSDTRVVLAMARWLMQGMLRKGHAYKQAGITLMDLARTDQLQADLFAPATIGNDALMGTMDSINRRFGRGTTGFGASGWQRRPEWGMRQLSLSRCYTTRIADLPSARC